MDEDLLLRRAGAAVRGQVADVEPPRFLPHRRRRRYVTPVAVAACLGVLGALVLSRGQDARRTVVTAEGPVIGTTSAGNKVLRGTLGPPPEFGTKALGEQVPFGVPDENWSVPEAIERRRLQPGSSVIFIGRIGEFELYETDDVFEQGHSPCLNFVRGALTGYGICGLRSGEPTPVVQRDAPVKIVWPVPTGTSVVALSSDGKPKWQRPVENVAAFLAMPSPRYTLTAYSADGSVLRSVNPSGDLRYPSVELEAAVAEALAAIPTTSSGVAQQLDDWSDRSHTGIWARNVPTDFDGVRSVVEWEARCDWLAEWLEALDRKDEPRLAAADAVIDTMSSWVSLRASGAELHARFGDAARRRDRSVIAAEFEGQPPNCRPRL